MISLRSIRQLASGITAGAILILPASAETIATFTYPDPMVMEAGTGVMKYRSDWAGGPVYEIESWVKQTLTLPGSATLNSFRFIKEFSGEVEILVNGQRFSASSQSTFSDWAWVSFDLTGLAVSDQVRFEIRVAGPGMAGLTTDSDIGLAHGNTQFAGATTSDMHLWNGELMKPVGVTQHDAPLLFSLDYAPVTSPVPEPASVLLFGMGSIVVAAATARRRCRVRS